MAFLEWINEYSVSIDSIDEQHRHLLEIINKFEDAMMRGKGSRVMNEILNDLIGYTQEHFAYEEKLLEDANYPDLQLHQSQHRQLLQKVERFQYEFIEEHRRVTLEVRQFLKYWLTSHILGDDARYSDCVLKSMGRSADIESSPESTDLADDETLAESVEGHAVVMEDLPT